MTWHAYRWSGDGNALYAAGDAKRRMDTEYFPPLRVQAWLTKPKDMRKGIFSDVALAVEWLSVQLDEVSAGLRPGEHERYRSYLPEVRRRLLIGKSVTWALWTTGGIYHTYALVNPETLP